MGRCALVRINRQLATANCGDGVSTSPQGASRSTDMPRRKPPTASSAKAAPTVVSAADAGRLLLHAQGLADDPACRAATPRGVAKLVEQMGFVQLDTISTVERAHHLILASRISGYRPAML